MYLLQRAEQSENGWIAVVEYQRTGESGFWPSAATHFFATKEQALRHCVELEHELVSHFATRSS